MSETCVLPLRFGVGGRHGRKGSTGSRLARPVDGLYLRLCSFNGRVQGHRIRPTIPCRVQRLSDRPARSFTQEAGRKDSSTDCTCAHFWDRSPTRRVASSAARTLCEAPAAEDEGIGRSRPGRTSCIPIINPSLCHALTPIGTPFVPPAAGRRGLSCCLPRSIPYRHSM